MVYILSNTEPIFYFFIQNRDKTPFPEILFSWCPGYEIFAEKYKRERKTEKPVIALRRKAWRKLQAYNSFSFSSDKNNINGIRKCKSVLSSQYPQTVRRSTDTNGLFHLFQHTSVKKQLNSITALKQKASLRKRNACKVTIWM